MLVANFISCVGREPVAEMPSYSALARILSAAWWSKKQLFFSLLLRLWPIGCCTPPPPKITLWLIYQNFVFFSFVDVQYYACACWYAPDTVCWHQRGHSHFPLSRFSIETCFSLRCAFYSFYWKWWREHLVDILAQNIRARLWNREYLQFCEKMFVLAQGSYLILFICLPMNCEYARNFLTNANWKSPTCVLRMSTQSIERFKKTNP